jgi:hypothetical protein
MRGGSGAFNVWAWKWLQWRWIASNRALWRRHHRFSRDAGGIGPDDDELTRKGLTVLRLALPYSAVALCLAVTAWLAFAHLL